MWNSVTLKRSLLQISNARSTTGLCRSLSQAATHWEGSSAEIASTSSDESTSNNSHNNNNNSNGIIRFTMTPKPQTNSSLSRGYGTYESSMSNDYYEPQLDAYEDPLFDRTAAAEQMAQQMQDSYYYASFKATSEEKASSSSKNL